MRLPRELSSLSAATASGKGSAPLYASEFTTSKNLLRNSP